MLAAVAARTDDQDEQNTIRSLASTDWLLLRHHHRDLHTHHTDFPIRHIKQTDPFSILYQPYYSTHITL